MLYFVRDRVVRTGRLLFLSSQITRLTVGYRVFEKSFANADGRVYRVLPQAMESVR